MKTYIIEREIPGIGGLGPAEVKAAAAKSNAALAELAGRAEWLQSYVAQDKTFCVYRAQDEAAVREHARISGFPASRIAEIGGVIDPSTGR